MLYEKKVIKISEIVRMFNVSNETARRDLESIQNMGIQLVFADKPSEE